MKICVLGAGALGSVIGACLAESGSDVYLVCRQGAHYQALVTRGLELREDGKSRMVRVNVATDCDTVGPVDLVILLVKSFDTEAAMAGAGALFGPETVLLSLQNGLGHEEILKEIVGAERVIAGKSYVGGLLVEPGVVLAGRHNQLTRIGELSGQISERVLRIAAEFERAGLRVEAEENIQGKMWDKLLVNVATAALCSITRLTFGELFRLASMRDCGVAAVAEGIAVAKAIGIDLTEDNPCEIWDRIPVGLPFEFKPSMLQSIEKGSVTEIDYVNGSVVRLGEKYNVPTPVNRTLVTCVKGVERNVELSRAATV
ncbi:2-dehydropantoate 2-reductase [Paraburkholderia dipogonis]|uniref:2-dehydropantoate 2-reductase n=1 Tax=Paraburkholderia dipogonis TaxID=1211383 RepID=A0A4Y8MX89_9BURK|nr:2-dehydropantoate 2-reductase [Paraburkholderia dipogonis]TFE41968.1 2-dehydropantoate 2-reductase [Paraburkholderia dipogonis]